jgi:hypothetical protein
MCRGSGHALEFGQPGPELFELSAAHGAFLRQAVSRSRAGQQVKFCSVSRYLRKVSHDRDGNFWPKTGFTRAL